MKTWTNPELEELEVNLTAAGTIDWFIEELPRLPDIPVCNDDLLTGEDSDGDGFPVQPEQPTPDEEGTPS